MFPQHFLNSLIAGAIYTLVALGFTIIYRTVKFFHFAHDRGLDEILISKLDILNKYKIRISNLSGF